MVSGTTSILPKTPQQQQQQPQQQQQIQPNQQSGQQSLIKVAVQQVQQRVQILRGPDGKLQVRGLMPGQQLVQMPDGKLHVLNTGQTIAASPSQQTSTNVATNVVTTTPKIATTTNKIVATTPIKTTPGKPIAIKTVNQSSQITTPQSGQAIQRAKTTVTPNVVNAGTTTTPQKNTVVVANTGQIVQEQVQHIFHGIFIFSNKFDSN